MQFRIDVIKEFKDWRGEKFISKAYLKNIFNTALQEAGINKGKFEVAILLTDNQKMSELKGEFLGQNIPTNILSFPDSDEEDGVKRLGDIAAGYEIIQKESQEFGISFENHFTHLLVHAILHLLGHDHEDEQEFEIMKNLEINILRKLQIDSPPIYE